MPEEYRHNHKIRNGWIAALRLITIETAMREPSLQIDGWHLHNAEYYQRMAPDTFCIPGELEREGLQIGDFAKLVFEICTDKENERFVIERMWVVVTARIESGYVGVLDNDPREIHENDQLWSGAELPFSARHVIAIQQRDAASIELALREPRRRWNQPTGG